MKHLRLFLTHLLLLLTLWVGAAGFNKTTYYSAANGKKGEALKTALAGIIYRQNAAVSYDGLKSAYTETDVRSDNKLYDIYSQITNYTPGSAFASSYSKEGDGYNREHLIPQSLFSEASPMVSDLQHVYPSDAKMNGVRNNYCHGNVGTIINTQGTPAASGNFCYLGTPASTLKSNGCTEDYVFEPNDIYKGDIARVYFYFVTCYETKIKSWGSKWSSYGMFDGSTYPAFSNWAKIMLLEWSENDVVSQKEITRNDAVYNYPSSGSNNRNPFIDYPGLEQYIWGSYTNVAFDPVNYQNPYETPAPVTPSISLNKTEVSLKVGGKTTLEATTQNANGATVTWLSSNTSVATVSNAVVTGKAAGSAIIKAKITVNGTDYTATCNVTVTNNTTPVVEGDTYVKVTSTSDLTDGQYLIVYETGNLAFDGGNVSGNANCYITIAISNNKIDVTNETKAAEFTLTSKSNGYSIKGTDGKYVGHTGSSNSLATSNSDVFTNTITITSDGADIGCNSRYLRYNTKDLMFRYYKTGQAAIQLYKKVVTETPVLLGDVNKDDDITIADVTALVNIILGKDNGPEPLYNHDAADVNEDGGITIADVTALVNIILGKTN